MATTAVEQHPCVTPNCGGQAKLRCPTCVKLGRRFHWIIKLIFWRDEWLGVLDGSYFCSQDCFKSYWQEHKKIHVQASMYYWMFADENY
jgi:methionyl aminopeptidase